MAGTFKGGYWMVTVNPIKGIFVGLRLASLDIISDLD